MAFSRRSLSVHSVSSTLLFSRFLFANYSKSITSKSTTTVTGDNKNNNEDDNDDNDDDDDDDDEYIYYDNSEDAYMICCDLDEGSFINSADYEYQYNMALGTTSDDTTPGILYNDPTITNKEKIELWYGCEMKFYASQDIKMGEEIRADYSDFVESDGWKFLGL